MRGGMPVTVDHKRPRCNGIASILFLHSTTTVPLFGLVFCMVTATFVCFLSGLALLLLIRDGAAVGFVARRAAAAFVQFLDLFLAAVQGGASQPLVTLVLRGAERPAPCTGIDQVRRFTSECHAGRREHAGKGATM